MSEPLDLKQYPILYVDDERANLLVFLHNFEDEFTVLTAESGEEALRILGEREVAILVADQRMPGMTGAALAEQVRLEHPDVVRMILTAYADIHAAIESINRGQVSRYITKPWRREDLGATLRAGIEVYALAGQVRQLRLRMMRSERLALVGFVAAGIAHDLKSPVAVLATNLETLRTDVDSLPGQIGTSSDEAAELIAEIEEIAVECEGQARQLGSLIDTIRLHVGERRGRIELIDLSQLVDSTLKLCRGEIIRKARLRVESQQSSLIQGDPAQLGQVFLNLLVNAIQAIDKGLVRDNEIAIQVGVRDGRAEVTVSDTGKGIPPDLVGKIFDPFFSTKEGVGGTGLGLAIVRQILERHGGEISVVSTLGQGATFTVRLPIAEDDE